jgi:hypothetical protein
MNIFVSGQEKTREPVVFSSPVYGGGADPGLDPGEAEGGDASRRPPHPTLRVDLFRRRER